MALAANADTRGTTPEGERTPARDLARANAFDLLRLVGALLVLVEHSWVLPGSGYPLFPESSGVTFGRIGVGIFFLTSGYLITASWLADPAVRRFLLRRALRIYPLYAAVVTVLALVVGPLLSTLSAGAYFRDAQTWTYLGNNLLIFPTEFDLPGVFTDNPASSAVNGSLWTIPTELLCYLAVLGFGMLGGFRFRWVVVVPAVVALAATLAIAVTAYDGTVVPRLLAAKAVEQVALFAVGAAAFVLARGRGVPWWGVGAAIGVWLITWGTPVADFTGVLAVGAATLALAFRAPAALRHPTGAFDLSYGIYLVAYPVQQTLVLAGVRNPWLLLLLTLAVTVPVATGTWLLLERPALRLKPRAPRPATA